MKLLYYSFCKLLCAIYDSDYDIRECEHKIICDVFQHFLTSHINIFPSRPRLLSCLRSHEWGYDSMGKHQNPFRKHQCMRFLGFRILLMSLNSIPFHSCFSSLKTPWNLAVGILSIQWRQFVLLLFKDCDYDDVKDWTISRFHGVWESVVDWLSFSQRFHSDFIGILSVHFTVLFTAPAHSLMSDESISISMFTWRIVVVVAPMSESRCCAICNFWFSDLCCSSQSGLTH